MAIVDSHVHRTDASAASSTMTLCTIKTKKKLKRIILHRKESVFKSNRCTRNGESWTHNFGGAHCITHNLSSNIVQEQISRINETSHSASMSTKWIYSQVDWAVLRCDTLTHINLSPKIDIYHHMHSQFGKCERAPSERCLVNDEMRICRMSSGREKSLSILCFICRGGGGGGAGCVCNVSGTDTPRTHSAIQIFSNPKRVCVCSMFIQNTFYYFRTICSGYAPASEIRRTSNEWSVLVWFGKWKATIDALVSLLASMKWTIRRKCSKFIASMGDRKYEMVCRRP